MRNPPGGQDGSPPASGNLPTPRSWRAHKDLAKVYFQNESYNDALASYRAALSPDYHCPASEKQILLSNVVACRLKIGGAAMNAAAVEDAKQCVALNDRWSKGHVRLASAYIALGGHSNDACNSLQRALSLDPGNATARQMLLQELRRDRMSRDTVSGLAGDDGIGGFPQPSAPPADDSIGSSYSPPNVDSVPPNPNNEPVSPLPNDYMGSSTARSSAAQSQHGNNHFRRNDQRPDAAIDDSLTIIERIQFFIARMASWYQNHLSEDLRTLFKVLLGLLVLYVAFGGRFGLNGIVGKRGMQTMRRTNANHKYESSHRKNHGDHSRRQRSSHETGYYDRLADAQSYHRTSRNTFSHDRSASRPSSIFNMPNLFDGSILSLVIMLGIGYVCHKIGVNPFHALWMLNAIGGHRRVGFGMQGMGMMGMGYGMLNNMGLRRGIYGGQRQWGWGRERR